MVHRRFFPLFQIRSRGRRNSASSPKVTKGSSPRLLFTVNSIREKFAWFAVARVGRLESVNLTVVTSWPLSRSSLVTDWRVRTWLPAYMGCKKRTFRLMQPGGMLYI